MNNSKIIYPSALLSQYVKYYWVLKAESRNTIQTIPSGCVHLVFHRGEDIRFSNGEKQPESFIRGQFSDYGELHTDGHIDMIAVVFRPLGLVPFISIPQNELYNQYIDIEALERPDLEMLKRTVSNEEDGLKCIQHIEMFLLSKLGNFNNYSYNRLFNAIQLIEEMKTEVKVSDLADKACLGYRHFKREFHKYIGVDPKEYLRIIRFQKALYILQNKPTIDMGELASICEFYDNSHLVKDFKSMSGCSPTEYLSSRKPHSTFFSKSSRLNLIKEY